MDERNEGVYCHWETYPLTSGFNDNIFVVERVNGDATVSRFECARSEVSVIFRFLSGLKL